MSSPFIYDVFICIFFFHSHISIMISMYIYFVRHVQMSKYMYNMYKKNIFIYNIYIDRYIYIYVCSFILHEILTANLAESQSSFLKIFFSDRVAVIFYLAKEGPFKVIAYVSRRVCNWYFVKFFIF